MNKAHPVEAGVLETNIPKSEARKALEAMISFRKLGRSTSSLVQQTAYSVPYDRKALRNGAPEPSRAANP